jgi:hypothetical protein
MSKTVNYTDAQVAELTAAYGACESDSERTECVAEYAEAFGKTPASIRAKLVREGVYVAKADTAKNGAARVKKDSLVEQIASVMGVTSEALPGLEKAGKVTLRKVLAALETAKASAPV